MKFKVGDKVKYIGTTNAIEPSDKISVGMVGKITFITGSPNYPIRVRFDEIDDEFSENELELVEEKGIGERIRHKMFNENPIIINKEACEKLEESVNQELEINAVSVGNVNNTPFTEASIKDGTKLREFFNQDPEEAFQKFDSGKPMMGLIPPKAEIEVAKCLTKGAIKYGAGNYKKCEDYSRYIDAALRHINEYRQGNKIDDGEGGTNTHHLANCIASLMFVMERDLEGEE
jgi:hypothetical protein